MAFKEFSKEFNAYRKLRDNCVSGLEKVSVILNPDKLPNVGFKLTKSEYFSEGDEEHEFHIYKKGGSRIVYLQTYIEKEGGMYIQTFYASPELIENFLDNYK